MKLLKNVTAASIVAALSFTGFAPSVFADKLDDVIGAGKVRCGVVLDFPPIGYRDAKNEPAGFDVEYCKDLATAMEVDFEIIPVTWAERLPVIVNNRADVVFRWYLRYFSTRKDGGIHYTLRHLLCPGGGRQGLGDQ